MLGLIYGAIIVLSMITRDEKKNWIIYAFFLCVLLWTSNGTYADFEGYYYIFERINDTGINLVGATSGWFLLCRVLGMVGLNYYGMTLILAIVSCFFLHELFLKFEANENVIWAVIFIFPLLINGIQIRFFLAMSIVAFGLKFLIFNNKFAMIKFATCVLLATTIHSAAIIFIILILVLVYEKFNVKENILITVIVFGTAIIGVRIVPNLAKIYLHQSQYDRYIANSYTTTTFKWNLAIVSCWLITLLLFEMLLHITPIEERKRYKEIKYDVIFKRIKIILFLLGLTLPLLSYDRNFHRFIQLGYILDAIVLGIYWKHIGSRKYDNQRERRLFALAAYVVFLIPAIYSYEFVPTNTIAPLFKIVGFPGLFK